MICLASFEQEEAVCLLECGHVFHQDCIGCWVARFESLSLHAQQQAGAARCPLCRHELARPAAHGVQARVVF